MIITRILSALTDHILDERRSFLMNPKSKITLTTLLILSVALTRAMAQFAYNAIDLGTLGGPTSTANAIDPAGQVAGFSLAGDGSGHAFFFTNGTMHDLGNLGGVGMIDPTTGNKNGALGTNIRGEIVGFGATDDGSLHAFLYANGEMVDLNAITDLTAGGFKVLTAAKAINDFGLIVGDGIMTTGDRHAFLLMPAGVAAGAQEGPAVIPTKGGQWSYANDKWGWAASNGAWGYSDGGWQWNGLGKPPTHHPHTPPPPPPTPPTPPIRKTPTLTPFLTPEFGKSPTAGLGTPNAPTQPPSWHKTPFLTPGFGKSPTTGLGTPNAPTQPPSWHKTPFLTPEFGRSPTTGLGTPNAPPGGSSPVPTQGGNNAPVSGTPPLSATAPPSQTLSPSPSATPTRHRPRPKKVTPTPGPSRHPHTSSPSPQGHKTSPTPHPKPSPMQGEHDHEQHHHPSS
jgi:probable HAF family extracellular repeat protein